MQPACRCALVLFTGNWGQNRRRPDRERFDAVCFYGVLWATGREKWPASAARRMIPCLPGARRKGSRSSFLKVGGTIESGQLMRPARIGCSQRACLPGLSSGSCRTPDIKAFFLKPPCRKRRKVRLKLGPIFTAGEIGRLFFDRAGGGSAKSD